MIEWTALIPLVTCVLAWLGFIEKRLKNVRTELKDELTAAMHARDSAKDKLDKILYKLLKEDVDKMERALEKLKDKLSRAIDKS